MAPTGIEVGFFFAAIITIRLAAKGAIFRLLLCLSCFLSLSLFPSLSLLSRALESGRGGATRCSPAAEKSRSWSWQGVAVEMLNLPYPSKRNEFMARPIPRQRQTVTRWRSGVSSRPPHGLPHHQGGLTRATDDAELVLRESQRDVVLRSGF